MTAKLEIKSKECKEDLINLLVLISIAAIIGIYLIITTVMISKDGVFYIERAQQFESAPINIIKTHPPGYPFLILLAHKFVSLFINSTSNQIWVYSAQAITLLCKVLSFVPLYFIGKIFVGSRNSFWALLVLIFLPYPAEFGSDVLRDWPHIFFLACGFWAILWGAKNRNWWVFGLAGLSSGLGYTIRHVCIQVIIYGIIWLAYCFLKGVKTFGQKKNMQAVALLIVGFLIPVGPYTMIKGKILPDKLYPIIKSFSSNTKPDEQRTDHIHNCGMVIQYSAGITKKVAEASGNLIEKASANLMWFFVLPLLVGIHHHFRKVATQEEKLLIIPLVILNIFFLFLRYCYIDSDLTHRYILPLTVFTIFYIPTGLKLLSFWIVSRNHRDILTINISNKVKNMLYVLFTIGIVICLPKLLRPIRIEKQGYVSVTNWLKENTGLEDIIAAQDRRLYFYAERKGLVYNKTAPKQAKYIVRIEKNEDEKPEFGIEVREKTSVWVDKRKKKKRIVIYKVL